MYQKKSYYTIFGLIYLEMISTQKRIVQTQSEFNTDGMFTQ